MRSGGWGLALANRSSFGGVVEFGVVLDGLGLPDGVGLFADVGVGWLSVAIVLCLRF